VSNVPHVPNGAPRALRAPRGGVRVMGEYPAFSALCHCGTVPSVRVWRLLLIGIGIVLLLGAYFFVTWARFPSDRTVEGVYLRVIKAVIRDEPTMAFAYLETPAQHACYTIRDVRRRSLGRISAEYPEPERGRLSEEFGPFAAAADGADVFSLYARKFKWFDRLRRDLSGVAKVETEGERATLITVRGTRYAFRRRENGIWGLTMFTPKLVAESERASRDEGLIEQAAEDYARARKSRAAEGNQGTDGNHKNHESTGNQGP
jgi:hypothetical protein